MKTQTEKELYELLKNIRSREGFAENIMIGLETDGERQLLIDYINSFPEDAPATPADVILTEIDIRRGNFTKGE